MSSLLVVRAHPLSSTESGSMRLTDAFVSAYRDAHPGDRVVDVNLYSVAIPEIDLDLLSGWNKLRGGTPFVHLHNEEQNKITLFDHYTAQFLDADKVVLANPLWNLQVPTRMKAWIDTVCVAGKTFRYNAEGVAEGLITDKAVAHIQTSGGVFAGNDPASQYVATMMRFLGVTDFRTLTAEGMDYDPSKAESILEDAEQRVIAAAREF